MSAVTSRPGGRPAAGPRGEDGHGGRDEIVVDGVSRSFGTTLALDRVDLRVQRGTVLGLLGPNGSGKTTLVRILTTLLRPDAGTASVSGFDVVREAAHVRPVIGLAGQYAAVDELLTGRENLELVARMCHLGRAQRRRRAADTLDRLGLTDVADRRVDTYSGGLRRRLDLGASLVGRPRVLLLDEPTTGLDPATRNDLWELVGELVADGTTVLLTTQYLEEADRLADRIVVLDHGRVIADGTSAQLKARLGGAVLDVTVVDADRLRDVEVVLRDVGRGAIAVDGPHRRVSVAATDDAAKAVVETARRCQQQGIGIDDIGVRRPSLDEVFLALTADTR